MSETIIGSTPIMEDNNPPIVNIEGHEEQGQYGPKEAFCEGLHAQKYRGPNESFEEAMYRLAATLSDTEEHRLAIKDILLNQRFLPAGRVQSAIGSGRSVTAYNCFVSNDIDDSMKSIMDRAGEAAETMRQGGGIGYDFSKIRPRGDRIVSQGSIASGPVSFMEIYNAVCGTVASAGHRRGAQMGVLRVDHPDIQEFVRAKQNKHRLTNFNVSVGVTDEFMNAVLAKEEFELKFNDRVYARIDASSLWDEIMRATWDWSEPGVLFLDRINTQNNLWYTESISATNPCVTGDTLLTTKQGFVPIQDLVGTAVDVWNGHEWTRVKPSVTGQYQSIVDIQFSDGSTLACTPYHKFVLSDGRKVTAEELAPNDKLEKFHHPVLEYGESVDPKTAYTEGFFCGDGSKETNRDRDSIWLYGSKKDLLNDLEHSTYAECAGDRIQVTLPKKSWSKTEVPLHYSLEGRLAWLAGLIDSDGSQQRKSPQDSPTVSISSVDRDFLMEVKMLCHSLGAQASLRNMKAACTKELPDGKGGLKEYDCKESFRLLITPASVQGLVQQGLPVKRVDVYSDKLAVSKYFVKVESITPRDGVEDKVYCFTDSIRHKGLFGCVSTAQCGEQPLPPNGACLLGSFNLTKYVDEHGVDYINLASDVQHVVRMMDNVIDNTQYPLLEQEKEAKSKRRMGLGVTGLANALESLGHSYGSDEFIAEMKRILSMIRDYAYMASANLAKEKGAFPLFDAESYLSSGFAKELPNHIKDMIRENGIRNSHLISIAPCGTISLTADNVSSGIEPVFSLEMERVVQTEDGAVTVPLKDYGYREWGVKGKTHDQLTIDEHLNVLLAAAPFVDSAISKTLNVGDDVTFNEFKSIYVKAWLGGAKGCTTFRPSGKRFGILQAKKTEEESPEEGAACTIDFETGVRTCDF